MANTKKIDWIAEATEELLLTGSYFYTGYYDMGVGNSTSGFKVLDLWPDSFGYTNIQPIENKTFECEDTELPL